MIGAVILEEMDKQKLLNKFAEWQKNNPQIKNIEIHYSHSIVSSTTTSVCIDKSYSMLISFDEET